MQKPSREEEITEDKKTNIIKPVKAEIIGMSMIMKKGLEKEKKKKMNL